MWEIGLNLLYKTVRSSSSNDAVQLISVYFNNEYNNNSNYATCFIDAFQVKLGNVLVQLWLKQKIIHNGIEARAILAQEIIKMINRFLLYTINPMIHRVVCLQNVNRSKVI